MTDHVRRRELRRHIKELKMLLEATIEKNCETRLYLLEYHLLDHGEDDLD